MSAVLKKIAVIFGLICLSSQAKAETCETFYSGLNSKAASQIPLVQSKLRLQLKEEIKKFIEQRSGSLIVSVEPNEELVVFEESMNVYVAPILPESTRGSITYYAKLPAKYLTISNKGIRREVNISNNIELIDTLDILHPKIKKYGQTLPIRGSQFSISPIPIFNGLNEKIGAFCNFWSGEGDIPVSSHSFITIASGTIQLEFNGSKGFLSLLTLLEKIPAIKEEGNF